MDWTYWQDADSSDSPILFNNDSDSMGQWRDASRQMPYNTWNETKNLPHFETIEAPDLVTCTSHALISAVCWLIHFFVLLNPVHFIFHLFVNENERMPMDFL